MSTQFKNYLLQRAAGEDAEWLLPQLTRLSFESRAMVERAGGKIDHIYFIEHGVVSVVAKNNGRTTEIGLVGAEGVTGMALLLGDDRSANEAYAQVAGEALCIGADDFRAALARSQSFRDLLLLYVHTFAIQTAQTALANAKAKLEERLARWLLMVHDRTGDPHIELTHQFMATMLGSRRAGVTVALHELEGHGLVRSERGRVTLTDRKELEDFAGEFYGFAEREYARLIGMPPN